jgi:hypothetical protein
MSGVAMTHSRSVVGAALALSLAWCLPLANRYPVDLDYWEPEVAGTRSHGLGCAESGPPQIAEFSRNDTTFGVQASDRKDDHTAVSVALSFMLPAGESLRISPRPVAAMDVATGRALDVTALELRRRDRLGRQTSRPIDGLVEIHADALSGGAERVWLVMSVAGAAGRLSVAFPPIKIAAHPVDLPRMVLQRKTGAFVVVPFC